MRQCDRTLTCRCSSAIASPARDPGRVDRVELGVSTVSPWPLRADGGHGGEPLVLPLEPPERAGTRRSEDDDCSEKGVRLAQKMQVGPCIPVGNQLEKAEVGPTSGPTWRLSY
jgi:hypothetical protein